MAQMNHGCGAARTERVDSDAQRLTVPLALPWPAWHTDDSAAESGRLDKLSNPALIDAESAQLTFLSAHSYYLYDGSLSPNPAAARISDAQHKAARVLLDDIQREMTNRFRTSVIKARFRRAA